MKSKLSIRELCATGIFAAATVVLSQIAIPLPMTAVPLSLGVVAVYLSGMFLNTRCAALCQICYLLLGAIGLPVFAGFQGGLGRLFGPTGGYLFAYPVMAAMISFLLSRIPSGVRPGIGGYAWAFASVLGSLAVCYLCGTAWLSVSTQTPFTAALSMAVVPFIPVDLLKIAASVLLFVPVRSRAFIADLRSRS